MDTEQSILQALDKVRAFDRGEEEGTLVLLDGNGYPVLTLEHAQGEPAK